MGHAAGEPDRLRSVINSAIAELHATSDALDAAIATLPANTSKGTCTMLEVEARRLRATTAFLVVELEAPDATRLVHLAALAKRTAFAVLLVASALSDGAGAWHVVENTAHRMVEVIDQTTDHDPGDGEIDAPPDRPTAERGTSTRTEELGLILRDERSVLEDAISSLPERLRVVVEGYFLQERRLDDIADELGVSETRVRQLRTQAIEMLRGAVAGPSGDS